MASSPVKPTSEFNGIHDDDFPLVLRRAKGGDPESVNHLMAWVRRVAHDRRYGKIPARVQQRLDASDILQEVDLAVWQHLDQFRGATAAEFVAWYRKAIANRVHNVVRHNRAKIRNVIRENASAPPADSDSATIPLQDPSSKTPSRLAERREQVEQVRSWISQLPARQRAVMELRHIQELTYAEIAARLGISEIAVVARHKRAVEVLKDKGLLD